MITQLEEALIARLEALLEAAGLSVRVESYGGQLTGEGFREVSQAAPVLWVVFSGLNRKRRVGSDLEAELSFTVIAASKAAQSDLARTGAYGGLIVGAYDLVSLALAGLEDWRSELLCQPLKTGAVRNLFNGRAERELLALYSLTVSATALIPQPAVASEKPEDLEVIVHSALPHLAKGPALETTLPQTPAVAGTAEQNKAAVAGTAEQNKAAIAGTAEQNKAAVTGSAEQTETGLKGNVNNE